MPKPASRTALRIAAYYGLSFAAASLMLGVVTWGFASRSLRHALDERLRSELTTLVSAEEREGRAALIADIVARDAVPEAGGYLLARANGTRVAGAVAVALPPPGLSDTVLLRSARGHPLPARAISVRLANGYVLAVVGETRSLARIEHTLLLISGAGFGLLVAIGSAGGLLIGHAIDRRLQKVDAAARAIIDGDLSRRMPVDARDDEFDRLSATLNLMLDHIALLMDRLRHVSDDIAHDLRTPLARLRATLETAGTAVADPDRQAAVERALAQVDAVMRLFSTVLRISEVERGAIRARFGPVRLDLILADLVDGYAPAAADEGRTLMLAAAEPITVHGDEGLLGQAIANLVENAIKHTPPGTTIRAVARSASRQPFLAVADDGPGIAPADREEALRRFGRGERSRSTPGSGLGLPLAAAIATAHGARLELDDAMPGLIVRIIFPTEG